MRVHKENEYRNPRLIKMYNIAGTSLMDLLNILLTLLIRWHLKIIFFFLIFDSNEMTKVAF